MGKNFVRKNVVRFSTLFLIFTFLVAMNGCSKDDAARAQEEQPRTALETIKKAGKIVVGTSADYPPYEFRFPEQEDGEIRGLDIDIAEDIARDLDVKLEIRDILFSDLFKHLQAGQVDFIIAGLAPTEARRKIADFSEIYYQAFQTILIRAQEAEKIKSAADLRGKKVGVQTNSIQESMAPTLVVGAEFVAEDTINSLVDGLKAGRIAALVVEQPVADSLAARHSELKSIELGIDANMIGSAIAVKKGNVDLINRINGVIQRLKKENKIISYVEDAKVIANK